MLKLRSSSVLGLVLAGAIWLPAGSAQSTTGLQRNGRWFTYNGRPTYLVGWDCQELACDPSLNYTAALDLFAQYRLNKVRIWLYCYWDPANFLHPWPYSNGKFNLDQWNPTYWSRVRGFVSAAQARNIVVEVTVFAPNNLDAASDWSSSTTRAAWNKAYNVNGVFSSNASGHFSPQFYNLNHPEVSSSGRKLQDYQRALVDKAVSELGGYANVYFEICNEFPVQNADIDSVYPWQRHWAQRIDAAVPRLVSCHAHEYVGDHTDGIQYFWSEPYVDVLDFHFTRRPDLISSLLHAAQTRGKILQSNEGGDPYRNLNEATQGAWGFFVSGGHYAFYEDDSSRVGSAGWLAGARRLRALRDVVEKVRFWELSPVDASGNELDALLTAGPSGANRQLIGKPGSEYVAYFWGTASTTSAQIQLPAGAYRYEWYDARNAALLSSGSVSGGGTRSIPPPAPSAWDPGAGLALVLKASSAPQGPFGGTAWAIPGTIQAENYDTGGEGVAYHDTTAGNAGGAYRSDDVDLQTTTDSGGGANVGWVASGEWLEYTANVAASGTYTLEARVASVNSGQTFRVEFGGANKTGSVTVPNTGGWQTWQTVTKTGLSLSAGPQVLRLVAEGGGFNINWIRLSSASSGFTVRIDSVSTGKPYSLGTALAGALPYIDRSYTLTSLSSALSGGRLIRTAMDDKYVTANPHLTFTVSQPATIWVCYDKRGSPLPRWLNDGTWTVTTEAASTTDGAASPMRVLRKTVGAGQVSLGGNHTGGANGSYANYFVVVKPSASLGADPPADGLPEDVWEHPGDSDGDGLFDEFEAAHFTDPAKADTDGDGIPDESELDGLGRVLWDVQAAGTPDPAPGGGDGGGGSCGATGAEVLLALGLLRLRRWR
jgi:hypothetical protein